MQPWGDATVDQVLQYAALSAKWENNDAIDRAITQAVGDRSRLAGYIVERVVPFNPVDKKTTAVFTTPEGRRLHATKGAPQVVSAAVLEYRAPLEENAGRVRSVILMPAAQRLRVMCITE